MLNDKVKPCGKQERKVTDLLDAAVRFYNQTTEAEE
jgi:hypothetical protein